MTKPPSPPDYSRRDFLKTTGTTALAAAAGSLLVPETARAARASATLAPARVIGANDRIFVGIVGVKGMGAGHIKHIMEGMPGANVEISAVCDVWQKARQTAKDKIGLGDERVFSDYRRLLDAKDLDAVIVATPDHTHAEIAIAAMESGRHVYVQKPMTRRLDDAFRMLDTAQATGRLVQVGTQGCSDPLIHRAREIVKSGALGRLIWAQASYCRQNPKGEWNYAIEPEATADTIDWKAWLGPAPKRAFSAERYFRWRKYWDYGTGVIGDLFPHRISPSLMAMGLEEYPETVTCMGGNFVDSDRGPGPDGKPFGERREVGEMQLAVVQFPSGVMLFLASGTVNERGVEDVIRGQKGNLTFAAGKLVVEPERPFSDDLERKEETFADDKDAVHAAHVRNLFDAMRGQARLHCPIDDGIRIQTIVSMAEKSFRERRQVRFDRTARKMIA